MLFYKLQAKIIENKVSDITEEQTSKKIKDSFKNFNAAQDNIYCFISDCKDDTVCCGMMVADEKMQNVSDLFPWDITPLTVTDQQLCEITSREFCTLLSKGQSDNLVGTSSDNFCVRELGSLISVRWPNGILHNENFYSEGIVDELPKKESAFEQSLELLWDATLDQELDRVFSEENSQNFLGHPVHYLLRSDNYAKREKAAKVLISALYKQHRLLSKRFCSLSVSLLSDDDRENLSRLYKCYAGGTVILRFNAENYERGRGCVTAEMLEYLSNLVKENQRQVLTVFCFPLSAEKEKELLFEGLESLTVVDIADCKVSYERAKQYLEAQAKAQNFTPNQRLFDSLNSEKMYMSGELDTILDSWCHAELKTVAYPSYKAISQLSVAKAQQQAVGTSFAKLMGLTGLAAAKKVITQAVNYAKAQKVFAEKGMKNKNLSLHSVFCGNPGTAKTTVARLFADILRENGVLSSGHIVECGRCDLVGKYVGHTAALVRTQFKRAKGGVLFIDEAYSLVDDRSGSYGDEAINAIVQEMENNRETTVVIFAGYTDKMRDFLNKNPGLRSRIAFQVPFDDYSVDELCDITKYLADQDGITLSDQAMEKLSQIYAKARSSTDFGNGRFVRNALEKARMAQATRLLQGNVEEMTFQDVATITADDVEDPVLEFSQRKPIGFCA